MLPCPPRFAGAGGPQELLSLQGGADFAGSFGDGALAVPPMPVKEHQSQVRTFPIYFFRLIFHDCLLGAEAAPAADLITAFPGRTTACNYGFNAITDFVSIDRRPDVGAWGMEKCTLFFSGPDFWTSAPRSAYLICLA